MSGSEHAAGYGDGRGGEHAGGRHEGALITVVGTGTGTGAGAPLPADVPAEAALVVGGRRHLEAAALPEGAGRIVLGPLEPALEAMAACLRAGRPVVVLASGDPGFFGVVRILAERFGAERLDVRPGVSSVAAAFARLGLPWDDAVVVSAHGRDLRTAVNVCRAHPKVAVLTGPGAGPAELGAALSEPTSRTVGPGAVPTSGPGAVPTEPGGGAAGAGTALPEPEDGTATPEAVPTGPGSETETAGAPAARATTTWAEAGPASTGAGATAAGTGAAGAGAGAAGAGGGAAGAGGGAAASGGVVVRAPSAGGRVLVVASALGDPVRERLERLTPAEAAVRDWGDAVNVVLCLDESRVLGAVRTVAAVPAAPAGWALEEAEFTHRDSMITKFEVRALALARLGPRLGDLVWDVGAGSGSVAVECARLGAAAVAVERGADGVARIRANAAAHGVDVHVVHGSAPEALACLDDPDAVFVGGGGGELPAIVAACAARARRTVVVALAALDRVPAARAALTGAGFSCDGVLLQSSRLAPLPGDVTRLAAANPVFLLWGVRPRTRTEGVVQ